MMREVNFWVNWRQVETGGGTNAYVNIMIILFENNLHYCKIGQEFEANQGSILQKVVIGYGYVVAFCTPRDILWTTVRQRKLHQMGSWTDNVGSSYDQCTNKDSCMHVCMYGECVHAHTFNGSQMVKGRGSYMKEIALISLHSPLVSTTN